MSALAPRQGPGRARAAERRADPADSRHRRAVQGSQRAGRSRRSRRSAARRSSICSSRPRPARGSRSSSPRSGCRADTVNVATSGSSVSKGETLVDTARNLEAMRIDMVVIRHGASGAAQFLGERIESNVINAGDGKHEHPTQGLLDMLTLRDRFGAHRGAQGRHLRRHPAQPRGAQQHLGPAPSSAREVGVCGPRSLLPRNVAGARRDGSAAHRGRDPVGRRAQHPAAPARADAGGLHPVAARVQPRLRRHAASGWRGRRRTSSSCTRAR